MNHRHGHGHGPRSIDRLAYQSGMGGWNPVFKTTLAVGTLVLCLAADRPAVSVAVIVALAALQKGKGGLPLQDYLGLLLVPLTFLLLGGAAVACDVSAAPAGDWNLPLPWFYLCASADSVRFAAALVLKALGAVSAMYLLALTTTACELVDVLRRAHLPPLLCELMYLIYRFVFVLLDMYGRMRQAAGARLGWRDFRSSCRSFGGTAGNLLVLALRRSRVYADAMTARGYDGDLRFLEEEKPVRGTQIAWMLLFWAVLVALAI
ncbi:cobalt ECF transporter T component CbiQ [Candidatus Agathobaculum pullicola]|uniref:cobalt ECF transporter T component CbiQ n=1 Tax=Candidatus Agathobaculum pullicola TaxID=2838426 RepID=UPI003F930BA1